MVGGVVGRGVRKPASLNCDSALCERLSHNHNYYDVNDLHTISAG